MCSAKVAACAAAVAVLGGRTTDRCVPKTKTHVVLCAAKGGLGMATLGAGPEAGADAHVRCCDATHVVPLAGKPADRKPGGVDIWLVAGQSNAIGFNDADGEAVPDLSQPAPGKVLQYFDRWVAEWGEGGGTGAK